MRSVKSLQMSAIGLYILTFIFAFVSDDFAAVMCLFTAGAVHEIGAYILAEIGGMRMDTIILDSKLNKIKDKIDGIMKIVELEKDDMK